MPDPDPKPKQQWIVTKQIAVEGDSPEDAIANLENGIGMSINAIPRRGDLQQPAPAQPVAETAATKKLEQRTKK